MLSSEFDFVIEVQALDRKSTRLNSSHLVISYAVFCLKKKNESLVVGGTEHVKKILVKALVPEKAEWLLSNLSIPTLKTGLYALDCLNTKAIDSCLMTD